MRNLLIAIGIVACAAALAGCDVWNRITAPPRPQIVRCHCTPTLRGASDTGTRRAVRRTAPVRYASQYRYTRHRRYAGRRHYAHHRNYANSGTYRWKKRYAERSVDIYNYSSGSQSYGAEGYAGGESYGYGYAEGYGHGHGHGWHAVASEGASHIWADGYGRRHRFDESAVRHYAYQARQRTRQAPERLDPWHGYDDDWD